MSGAAAGSGLRGALTSADTVVMCRTKNSGTVAVGISASGSSVIGALDGVTLSSWNPVSAEGQGHDQVRHAERVEPQGGTAARATREPARDQRRSDTGSDVAQARGQGEQRRQVAEGQVEQEGHPGHAGRVRKPQAAHHARRRQGARHHWDPAQCQQQAQVASYRDRKPRQRAVPAVTRDHRAGGQPAAEHDGRGPGEQRRTPPARPARSAPPYSTMQVRAATAVGPAMVIAHR